MARLNELSRDSHSTVASTPQELIQQGPFDPSRGGDAPDIDPESYAVDLPVREAGNVQSWTPVGGLSELLLLEEYNDYDGKTVAVVRIEGLAGTSVLKAKERKGVVPSESGSEHAVKLDSYNRQHIGAS